MGKRQRARQREGGMRKLAGRQGRPAGATSFDVSAPNESKRTFGARLLDLIGKLDIDPTKLRSPE